MCDKPTLFSRLPLAEPLPARSGLEVSARAIAGLPTPPASSPADAPPIELPTARGSRRRRLWELPTQSLCPVIGVCLPMQLLRRRLGKLLGGQAQANDYELHCGAINECGHRGPVAEALQKELDQRYAIALKQSSQHKTPEALGRFWTAAQNGNDVAGALWSTLTHARCDAALQEQVLRDIHMLQHQVGAANRADLQRMDALEDENAVLGRELALAQSRSTRLLAERAQQLEASQAECLRLRGELMARDMMMAGLRDELQQLEDSVPGLRHRHEQARQLQHQQDRIHQLERALLTAQQTAEREQRRSLELQRQLEAMEARAHQPLEEMTVSEPSLPSLDERAVLCVGGRPAVVPIYRQLIERTGGRFLHHDGGEEDAVTKLDASLAAADLVICQTGCISHDAYWRVKDHCKRHGKQCVFVDKPSASGLRRALCTLKEESAVPEPPEAPPHAISSK
ncbi:DUF2325 domain-containing protein [Roseateles terrae]|uniref:DUF2325 domain-containing protein n=1 Tax=Roseateles terrae TaxID=431060 RepID=A0ABR6GST4_9BURK|nr:DUF2325 domain-containing protein [Roseateles terrae]MBB3195115.1 hypothetical protein [Roseateles terrae]OWQ87141.1 hypothetical protein CDN98_09820 [Roseateles terrae]